MVQGSHGQTIHLVSPGIDSEAPLPSHHPHWKRLQELGYQGPPPRTAAEAEALVYREEFLRQPATLVQRRLIEIICLYGGHCFDPVTDMPPNRWEAGCWIKAHIGVAGDWPYFDG
jgi:hypothetical protein